MSTNGDQTYLRELSPLPDDVLQNTLEYIDSGELLPLTFSCQQFSKAAQEALRRRGINSYTWLIFPCNTECVREWWMDYLRAPCIEEEILSKWARGQTFYLDQPQPTGYSDSEAVNTYCSNIEAEVTELMKRENGFELIKRDEWKIIACRLGKVAISLGRTDIWDYANHGCSTEMPMLYAVEKNQVHVLDYMFQKYPEDTSLHWKDNKLLMIASTEGSIEVIQYLLSKGYTLDIEQTDNAEDVRAYMWMIERGCPYSCDNTRIFTAIAKKEEDPVYWMERVREKGVRGSLGEACLEAIIRDRLDVVQYMISLGMEWGYSQTKFTVTYGRAEILKYIHEKVAPIPNRHMEGAIYETDMECSSLEVYQYIYGPAGVPMGEDLMDLVSERHLVDVAQALVRMGCPWNLDACFEQAYMTLVREEPIKPSQRVCHQCPHLCQEAEEGRRMLIWFIQLKRGWSEYYAQAYFESTANIKSIYPTPYLYRSVFHNRREFIYD
ncbi:hypothetical protein PROFUN_04686 [Planoprotostelium fungivorum]|uniref:F-box domain-containing protein n=1 Tax=Planoprotostelium fungivorum TaxID=1890364 RepID=A0A2P6NFT7_9EUKA|nr:hypothetical protein PROFUN_04686 [Planoprotostelium fungivorum]